MNEFDDLKGLPPDSYKPKIPEELEQVQKPVKPTIKSNINYSDVWNITWAIFSDYALSKLDATKKAAVMSFRELIIAFGIFVVLFLLAVWSL